MTSTPAEHRILIAARRLFFEYGFEKVSTNLLASEAAVSKATLYRHFKNMADVLRQVTGVEAQKFRESTPPSIETLDDLRRALTLYGTRLLTFLNATDTIKFVRLMHEEARYNPDIGVTFYEAVYGQSI